VRIGVVADLIRANGAGVMALTAANMLHGDGHETVLIAGALDAGLGRESADRFFGAASFTQDQTSLADSVSAADHAMFLRTFRSWFDQQITRFELDALYVHNCGRLFEQNDLVDLSRRIPVMHTMHDEWFYTDAHYTFETATGEVVRTYEPRHGESLVPHDYDSLFDLPDRIGTFLGVGPSQWLTDRARRVFPTIEFSHIPNPVDGELFSLQDRGDARDLLGLPHEWPIAMFVGNPTQVRKGFDIFEAGCRSVKRATGVDPIRFVVGGDGSVATRGLDADLKPGALVDRLQLPTSNPLRDLGIDGPAIVLADLDQSLMAASYGAANVLIHPSRIDNLPTVPIEAGLCGTRCLASDVGGTRETIADSNDLFAHDVEVDDLGSSMAAALEESWSESPEQRRSRREIQAARFSLDSHRTKVMAALETLCEQGATRG